MMKGSSTETRADAKGVWRVHLPAMSASKENRTLTAKVPVRRKMKRVIGVMVAGLAIGTFGGIRGTDPSGGVVVVGFGVAVLWWLIRLFVGSGVRLPVRPNGHVAVLVTF